MINTALDRAKNRGRTEIARIIETKIDNLQKDFSEEIGGRRLTDEFDIPCILCSGRSTDPGLPARIISLEGGQRPRWEPAPWYRG